LALIGTGWRAPFLVVACMALLLALTAVSGRFSPDQATVRTEGGEAPARSGLRRSAFWALSLLMLLLTGMEMSVLLWLPICVQQDPRFTQAEGQTHAVMAASCIFWACCLARFAAPLLLSRVSPRVVVMGSTLCICGLLIGTQYSLWAGPIGILGLVLCGFAFAWSRPTFYALSCELMPAHKGLLAYATSLSHMVAFVLVFLVGGIIADHPGPVWMLRLAVPLGALAVLGTAFWVPRIRSERP
jgi:fucose permease